MGRNYDFLTGHVHYNCRWEMEQRHQEQLEALETKRLVFVLLTYEAINIDFLNRLKE